VDNREVRAVFQWLSTAWLSRAAGVCAWWSPWRP